MLKKKLIRTALRYKAQFLSMVLMVMIGVGIFLGFNMEWKSLEEDAFRFLEETNYADYRIYAETGFTKEDIQAICEIDGVDAATRYFDVNVGIADSKKSLALNVSENNTVSTMLLTEGDAYDETSDGIWLSDRFARENEIAIGDVLCFIYRDFTIEGEVRGLVKCGEHAICVADENQLMPDFETFGFAYISPKKLEEAIGTDFYPQINLISDLEKEELEERIQEATGTTFLVLSKKEHISYAGVLSESEEGKTMGSILPVLFLLIGILTMVTTMHRIAANEKVQIGTLKALGFHDRRILLHYTSYGFLIGVAGMLLGGVLGYLIAAFVISPHGMMSTYLDLPEWKLYLPGFCIPVMLLMLAFLTFISYLSVKRMLKGSAADALRPYTPKVMKKSVLEKCSFWNRLSFGTKWNIRDILRHKSRSAMTLLGVGGCTVLLVAGLGMKDTMLGFLDMLDEEISLYQTKLLLSESAENEATKQLAKDVEGDWQATAGISYEGKTITLEIHHTEHGKIGFLSGEDESISLTDDGVYLCQRLKDTAKPGDTITFSPYGSEESYQVKVAGYFRSLVSESIVMTDVYAEKLGIPYHISSIYTDQKSENIASSDLISAKQEKSAIMDSYNSFMEMLYLMIVILIIASVLLGIVVLYNLGIMSYVERYRELATLKVLGFRDKHISRLLISQNLWLTVLGVLLGIPFGVAALHLLIAKLVSEYELSVQIGFGTYCFSTILTFGVSLLVGWMVSKKNRNIDMVEALKGTE